jgi:hypothetical protein
MVDALLALGVPEVVLEVTDFADGSFASMIGDLRAAFADDPVEVIDRPNRSSGAGYYQGFCFKVYATIDERPVEVGDGGFVDWTRKLVGSEKERLLISGMGLDRLAIGLRQKAIDERE